jgi:hypothetical protein
MFSAILSFGLIASAEAHGWMVHPIPNQPGALGYAMEHGEHGKGTNLPMSTPAFGCPQCEMYGFQADACGCGVCGSYGNCSESCIATADRPACFATDDPSPGNNTCWGSPELGTPYDPKSWYTNNVTVDGENPWSRPGEAKVWSSCGVLHHFGVTDTICESDPWNTNSTTSIGGTTECDGRKLLDKARTVWPAGSTQEAAWAVCANHGGGVAYRLCPRDRVTEDAEATEACFQEHHLDFADNITMVRFAAGMEDKEFESEMVFDSRGKQWRKNIIPKDCDDAKFPGGCSSANRNFPWYSQVDNVKIPQDLTPGHYVLSWRWDCEANAQVWNNCADIEVTNPGALSV